MPEYFENILTALDHYLRSKASAVLATTTAIGTAASGKISNVPLFHIVVNEQIVFNWIFLFQCLGAAFVTMQMIHMIYRFYKFVTED
jgi:hypothetical protein